MILEAVELTIDEDVLANADAYRRHIENSVASAQDGGPRLVVFPELAGHLALFALSGRKANTVAGALAQAAVRRPIEMLRGIATTRRMTSRHAVLAALAPDGERWWKAVFAPLAQKLNAYVVAGSHLRVATDGALTNASFLFGPNGALLATTDKVNLDPGVEDAAPGGLALDRGEPEAIPITQTPFGTIATLIGYDAATEPRSPHERFVSLPEQLVKRGGVTVLANPAANMPEGLEMTFEAHPVARYGVTARLKGKVLDLAYDGGTEIVERTPGRSDGVTVLARGGSASVRATG
ncbi:MAG: nitrilase-related carbon-nitrogen hydrolase [Kofleriaceae bacterium]